MPLVETRRVRDEVYVYPASAAKALAADRVDEELFNVTGLVRMGYDDTTSKTLPVIARYTGSVTARSVLTTPKGAAKGRTLPSVDGVVNVADKSKAAEFFADVTSTSTAAGAKVKKVWLDRKVSATLDRSTTQVGATTAWAAGLTGTGTTVAVLDSGADGKHPDLQGRIVDSKDFTGLAGGALPDVHGHGTHTASTAGGSGAASGGAKRGVAPETGLVIGKVLDDSGFGAESWIIAGMEWASSEGADVISMSLGSTGLAGDCTDPLAASAQDLATSTNSLFVIAAGNSGSAPDTVSSPGCAKDVLTVGAVDRDDNAATFSSRGPAAYTDTIKPEISAPGVGISAARSGGTGDSAYVGMSGTSMATPHVAGAAAILKQANPSWSAARIKAALVATAKTDIGADVHTSGAGRLDISAALADTVTSEPVQGGVFEWPHVGQAPRTVQVPYTNHGDAPVTLSLTVDAVTADEATAIKKVPATLGATTVTIPAGGSAQVPLTLDPTVKLGVKQYGDITGRVVATGTGDTKVSTPFTFSIDPQMVDLTVKMIDRNGNPAASAASVDLVSLDQVHGERRYNDGAAAQTFQVRPGTFFLSGYVDTPEAGVEYGATTSLAYFARPELTINGDTTIVFDARSAHALTVKTDQPTVTRSTTLAFNRVFGEAPWLYSGSMLAGPSVTGLYADIQGQAKNGSWEFGDHRRLACGPDLVLGRRWCRPASHVVAAQHERTAGFRHPRGG